VYVWLDVIVTAQDFIQFLAILPVLSPAMGHWGTCPPPQLPVTGCLSTVLFRTSSGKAAGPKFTDDLRTILRQLSDLRQSYDLS